MYRLYLDFLEVAEKKRAWSISSDIPWSDLDTSRTTETTTESIELFCSEELYVPDYSSNGLALVRSMFGMAWFQTRWAFEESKHSLVLREYLTRSGLRSQAEFEALETDILKNRWDLPFATVRQMACYGVLQEGATCAAYKAQREKARAAEDKVLEAIFFYLGRDEAAHGGFYRALIELEISADREGTIADLAYVFSKFKMPGDGLIPNYKQRLLNSGAGLTPRVFLENVVWPVLITLQVNRAELKLAVKKLAAVHSPSSFRPGSGNSADVNSSGDAA